MVETPFLCVVLCHNAGAPERERRFAAGHDPESTAVAGIGPRHPM